MSGEIIAAESSEFSMFDYCSCCQWSVTDVQPYVIVQMQVNLEKMLFIRGTIYKRHKPNGRTSRLTTHRSVDAAMKWSTRAAARAITHTDETIRPPPNKRRVRIVCLVGVPIVKQRTNDQVRRQAACQRRRSHRYISAHST
ncbi:hypothetical protein KIN20_016979 [Parelaphostrongylus tenuis]|uniref:Uncharacterized protein n=1 Tax=Parelaphostrongylus tenuis TaxID=148309 RepID=A0AAD5MHZ4_PARTN|nr:hypothetical protein KIN20_016979 [Parelaphostrongylus tenuis]